MTEGATGFRGTSRYEIRKKLGQGGMGVVYEAFDRERAMVVALKTLSRVSPAAIYRLKQEFRSLAALRHDNLVTLYDLAHVDGRWLFTMDLVEGVDWMQYVRPRALSPGRHATVTGSAGLDWLDDDVVGDRDAEASAAFDEERLRSALVQLSRCLRTIHDSGRIHRDLKPSNILVRDDGRVVLLDFGLVTHLDRDDQASLQSTIVGTPAYMAPEQASGEILTEAVDWYAVGVMIYEALTGVRPFGGSMVQLLTSKQSSEPPPPSSLIRGLPDDLDALCVSLLRREPAARPTGDEVLRGLTRADHGAEVGVPPSRRRSLVGRDRELAALARAYESREGAHVVALESPAGMGRTALLRAFLSRLGDGAVVLAGSCQQHEAVPYKAFDAAIDALSRHLRQLDQDDVRGILPPGIGALVRIFPVLERVPAIADSRDSTDESPDVHTFRRRAFGALSELFTRLGDKRRVVLVIDDLHFGDRDSAVLLEELLRPPCPPLLLVASYRSTDRQSPLVQAIESPALRQRLAATWSTMVLSPLAPSEAHHLAASLLEPGAADVAAQIARESHGVPLLVVELARHATADATAAPTLEELLDRRILALSLPERALLEVLALAAAPLRLSVARRAASSSSGQAPDTRVIAELSAQHLLRSSWYRGVASLDIFSDHVRRAVQRSLPPEGHRQTHTRLARALEEAEAPPEIVAHHREHAGERGDAALLLAHAGESAMRSLAFHRAARFFERAHGLLPSSAPDRGLLLERLGDALAASGRSAEAGRRYLEASGESGTRRDGLDLQRLAAEHLMRSGHIDEGLAAVDGVLAEVGLSLPGSPRRALVDVVWQRARLRLRGLEATDITELSERERRKMDACWSVAVGLSMADTIVGADFHARHLLLALDSGDPSRVARALALEAAHVGSTGHDRQQRARELLDHVDALAERLRDPRVLGLAKLMRGCMALFTAEWQSALILTDEATTVFRERCSDVAWELASAQRFNHVALYYLGEIDELSRRVPAAMADARSRGDRFAESCAGSGSSAVVWLAGRDVDSAKRFLGEEPERWGTTRFALQHLLALQGLTLVDLYAGDAAAARARLLDAWPRMKSSHILRVQLLRQTMLGLRAKTAVAAAKSPADLDAAERDAHKLAREGLASSSGLATLIVAGVRALHDPANAVPLYHTAIVELERAKMALHAAAARARLGELLGGDEGSALSSEARRYMQRQRIAEPDRFVAMLAP